MVKSISILLSTALFIYLQYKVIHDEPEQINEENVKQMVHLMNEASINSKIGQ